MQLFDKIDQFIEGWNSNDQRTHTVGHNQFSDWTDDEKSRLRGFKAQNFENIDEQADVTGDLPDSVNWVTAGAVNEVQDQGHCGSCWAFSAVSAMESAHKLASGELLKLSEQQCVDCDRKSSGCNGGWQANCFYYAQGDKMVLETQYPYSGIADSCFSPYTGTV